MKPRILLVEDDPTSALFLAAAAEALPANVDTVATGVGAKARAAATAYALLLVDAHLPDGDGAGLLADLRAVGLDTPAIAHTATRDAAVHQALHEAGFCAVLVKPLAAPALRAALAGALAGRAPSRIAEAGPAAAADVPAAWDDATALRALNGVRSHVDALRQLFLAELPAARDQVLAAARTGDAAVLREALHRLRASCGFVGATRLDQAVAGLQEAPASAEVLARFDAAAQELLAP